MTAKNDHTITRLAVRLGDPESGQTIGTGAIYTHRNLQEQVYVLTAAHCLYRDGDGFSDPFENIELHFYDAAKKTYASVLHEINFSLVSASREADFAILVLQRTAVEKFTGLLPEVPAIRERHNTESFALKGFPSAAEGRELVSIAPSWAQDLPAGNVFQLHLGQDFSSQENAAYQVEGFSGSGIYLVDDGHLYLLGIFTRFLDAGKLIYGQYLSGIILLLSAAFLPLIDFSFFGSRGLNPAFFEKKATEAVRDLGPRFTENLNFRLPLAFRFHILAKDSHFKQRVSKVVDSYLNASNYNIGEHEIVTEAENQYEGLDQLIRQWFHTIDWSAEGSIDIAGITAALNEFDTDSQERLSRLRHLSYEKIKADGGKNKDYSYSPPFQGAINRLQQMQKNNRELLYNLDDLHIGLSNQPWLLVKGEAGSGKSHLLGDIVSDYNKKGRPALLLLGQLFKNEKTIWENILGLLGLSVNSTVFLETLDDIGRQVGSRVLLMIDALNEGAGKALWYPGLAGFISEVRRYPNIALVLSIRSSYWKAVVPSSVDSDQDITRITHEGFKGNEYKALNLFCRHYGIRQPNFPILAPEFTNPLLLQLVCQGIKASGEKVFPQGFQGISRIFGYYVKAVQDRLTVKRSGYATRPGLVKAAMEQFAAGSFKEKRSRYLSIEQAAALFDTRFEKFPELFEDLIEESVLIRKMIEGYDGEDKDVVYFAYERFGDFFLAEQLLSEFKTKEEVLAAFQKTETLGRLIDDFYWSNEGMLEAMAVLLPEKWGLEVTEVYRWAFEAPQEDHHYPGTGGSLNRWMVQSMKWRRLDSIDGEKIAAWINESGHFHMDFSSWLFFMTEMTGIAGHPFNADRLFSLLKKYSMAERDSFWQEHIGGYHGYNDNDIAFPITRLIDWAWQKHISRLTDTETARLVGQTLCWVLCTSYRGLRDQVTKSMVNLLQDQPHALVALLVKFDDIDDLYIKERLYAVAYGCALRTETKNLEIIAQTVYELIFKPGNPPAHILLRDYARNTVEYAVYHQAIAGIDLSMVRPPYRSAMPESFPSDDHIKKFERDHKSADYQKTYGFAENKIAHSVINWDFGRYTIDNKLSNFSPVSFRTGEEIAVFRAGLPRGGKASMKIVHDFFKLEHLPERRRRPDQKIRDMIHDGYLKTRERFLALLSADQQTFFEEQVEPYWLGTIKMKADSWFRLNGPPIKNWIVNRVFEMGYDGKLHGSQDERDRTYDKRTEGRIERIGKKYQWIALHEILAMLADNFKIRDRWRTGHKERFYNGAWELWVRDIDPSFTLRDRKKDDDDDEDFEQPEEDRYWWSDEKYDYWRRLPADWANSTTDLPSPLKTIQKTDGQGIEWLYLYFNRTWNEPKQVGEEKYFGARKEINYWVRAYLVPQHKLSPIVNWLKTKNLRSIGLPESHSVTNLLNREHYWSPISRQWQRENTAWKTFDGPGHKVRLTTESAIGELSEDSSGAHFQFEMPSPVIFAGMGLRYGDTDGEFVDSYGEPAVTNVSPTGCLVRKDKLFAFLKANKLSIIWALAGEKNAFNRHDSAQEHRNSLSGVYHFEDNSFTGEIKITKW